MTDRRQRAVMPRRGRRHDPAELASRRAHIRSDEGHEQVRAASGDSKLRRLAALKTSFDPTNIFRTNQNIVRLSCGLPTLLTNERLPYKALRSPDVHSSSAAATNVS
jgi:Berberine and berberine like